MVVCRGETDGTPSSESWQVNGSPGALMALMYLDIDGFKRINDQFGHQAGDELLRGFAGRLSQALRAGDVRARLGGDEFTVIMEGLPDPNGAVSASQELIVAMQAAFAVEQRTIAISTSIGLAFYRGGATTAAAPVKQADEMLYQAKGAGRTNVQVAPGLIGEAPPRSDPGPSPMGALHGPS